MLQTKSIIPLIIVLVLLIGAMMFTSFNNSDVPAEDAGLMGVDEPAVTGLGAEVYERSANPLGDAPLEANPFKKAKNPFVDAYTNPFE